MAADCQLAAIDTQDPHLAARLCISAGIKEPVGSIVFRQSSLRIRSCVKKHKRGGQDCYRVALLVAEKPSSLNVLWNSRYFSTVSLKERLIDVDPEFLGGGR